MTSSIQRDFDFHAATHINSFVMSYYTFSLFMEIDSDSFYEQNVAVDRIKLFISERINDSIFINSKEKKIIEKYTSCGLKVCSTPEDPYDQIIAVMLFTKLNAIVEGRLNILEISLSTSNSDGFSYIHHIDEHAGPFEESGWWCNPDLSISDTIKSKDKVVNLFKRAPSWDEMGLSWKEKELVLVPDIPFQTT